MNGLDIREAATWRDDALATEFARVRAATLALATPLTPEDCQVQSMPDASPTKWHLAHVTWFFETFVLERFEPRFRPFDAAFRTLFNSYYHGVGAQHPRAQRGLITTPTLEQVLRYRTQIEERIQALLVAMREATELRELVLLAPFDLASRPVTYGEFLAFMDDAGYQRPELWLSMGWDWVRTCGAAGVPPAPL